MAYIIYNPDSEKTQMARIAENDSDKAKYPGMLSENITTEEFNSLKNGTKKIAGHNGTNYIWEDTVKSSENSGIVFPDQSFLDTHISILIKNIKVFTESQGAEGHVDQNFWNTYISFLESFDTSAVTYPINTSWEKYCEDNSINYKNLLQLP
tara:strand:+ start:38 stop:493 length:456 start_codon:yes stop_codon:yes gene_type:complete